MHDTLFLIPGIEQFEDDRRRDRRYKDQQDDGGEVICRQKSGGQTLLRHDQGNLSSGHHADADLQGIGDIVFAQSADQSAADDLGQKRHDHETDTEGKESAVHAVESGL